MIEMSQMMIILSRRVEMSCDSQTDGWMDRQTDRQTERQTMREGA